MTYKLRTAWLAAASFVFSCAPAEVIPESSTKASANVSLDADQALMTLELLEARARGDRVAPSSWDRVFRTEGYRRVLQRELGMDEVLGIDRGYSDQSFLDWAQSDEALEGLRSRRRTLAAWAAVDVKAAASRAMEYLPSSVRLSATVYPIVRKQSNSFVSDLADNPAIFLSVGSDISTEELEMTLIHELYHVGTAEGCRNTVGKTRGSVDDARGWLSGFGEGLAVLAAAGGPDSPTHAAGDVDLRRAWNIRLDSVASDMSHIERFLLDVAEGRVKGEEARRRGMAFVNTKDVPQGAFYSLGWLMGATVERRFGRATVIAATCHHGRLLLDYQRAASLANREPLAEVLPLWSERLFEALRLVGSHPNSRRPPHRDEMRGL